MKTEVLKEAWEMRRKGIYTMREIADKLGVNRDLLMVELDAWVKQQSNNRINAQKQLIRSIRLLEEIRLRR